MRTVFDLLNIYYNSSNQPSRLTDINHNVPSGGPIINIGVAIFPSLDRCALLTLDSTAIDTNPE